MDKEALARRNRRLARAMHQPSPKQHLRNGLLSLIARAPVRSRRRVFNRALFIRPDHVGDMLLTTPAILALKRARPELSIHVLCGDACADLLAHYEEIDQVLTLPFPGFQRGAKSGGNPYLLALKSARRLRQIGYDSALIMRPDHWWGALLAFLAGIPQRIGYDLAGAAPFLTAACRHEHQHAVKQNMRLAEILAAMPRPDEVELDFPLRPQDRNYIAGRLKDWGIPAGKSVICLHPGSGASSKLWRGEHWASVADAVASEYDAAVVFTGAGAEVATVNVIAAQMKADAYSLAGSTSAGQLAALYARALVVLGPDSGAMHTAAAVHTPTVTLFGPADPVEFAPWGDPQRHAVVTSSIGCRPCRILDWRGDDMDFHPCVRDITVAQVLAETRRVLRDR